MTRHANKEGGWGELNDDQTCPACGRKICGARISDRKMAAGTQTSKCANKGVCHSSAGYQTDHPGYGKCKWHYGNTPAVSAAAHRQAIRGEMRRYGVPVLVDPEDALREEIHRTVGHVRWIADKVASVGDAEPEAVPDQPTAASANVVKMPRKRGKGKDEEDTDVDAAEVQAVVTSQPTGDDALVWGITEREVQAGGPGGGFDRVKIGSGMNAWLQVYMAERGHLAKICDIAMKANLEGRRLDWAEAMADRLITAFEEYASALGHDPKAPEVQEAAAASLERILAQAS